ncbi:hypothetical protein Aperf_G00000128230 [Anoplocephala perfoliata]
MDVYSPSHPTDQDAECEIPVISFDDITGNEVMGNENTQCSDKVAFDSEFLSNDKEYRLSKSPDLSPSLSLSSNNPGDVLNVELGSSSLEKTDIHSPSITKQLRTQLRTIRSMMVVAEIKDRAVEVEDRKKAEENEPLLIKARVIIQFPNLRVIVVAVQNVDILAEAHGDDHRHALVIGILEIGGVPDLDQKMVITDVLVLLHEERKSRSHSGSRSRQDRSRRDTRVTKNEHNDVFSSLTELVLPQSDPAVSADSKNDCQYDMDETSTPDISEDQNPSFGTVNENAAFVFQSQPPPPPPPLSNAPNFLNWQNQIDNLSTFGQINNRNLQSIPTTFIHNAFHQQQQQSSRLSGYNDNFQSNRVIQTPTLRELPPNLMSQRPAFNPVNAARFPGASQGQLMAFDGMLNPLLPFGLLGQPPPPPPPPPPSLAYTVPPPQFIQQIRSTPNVAFQPPPLNADIPRRTSPPPPPPPPPTQPNLLETLMSKAGLSTDGIAGLGNIPPGGSDNTTTVSMSAIPLPQPLESKSPMKKISKLINSAANNLLNQINTPVHTTTCSPPPPPPLPVPGRPGGDVESSNLPTQSHIPPLPPIAGTGAGEFPNGNGNVPSSGRRHRTRPENVQEMLAKRRRSEFASSREWQERIALEVRSFIKPFYAAGKVSKEDCRTVLKKSVNKIFRSRCTSIDTRKIGEFVKLYLRKYQKYRKWQARQQKLQSDSAAKEPPVQ